MTSTREKIREGLTIIDCTVKKYEKCSEGKFVKEYMNILNRQRVAAKQKPVWHKLRESRSAKDGLTNLRDWLKYSLTYTIHISAHGGKDEKTGETILLAGNSPFYLKDLDDIWSDRLSSEKPCLIILSACGAGHKDLINKLSKEGCRYCIAPVRETNWEHSAMFSTLFYTYLFYGPRGKYEPMLLTAAFQKARNRLPELTGNWKMFDNGKEVSDLAIGFVT